MRAEQMNDYLEAVPSAVTQACIIPLKNTAGFFRVINQ